MDYLIILFVSNLAVIATTVYSLGSKGKSPSDAA